jgi:biopolymer transport protein ExbB
MMRIRLAAVVVGLALLAPAAGAGAAPVASPTPGDAADLPPPAAPVAAPAAKSPAVPPPTGCRLLQEGGPVMILLYLCAALVIGVAVERALRLRRRNILPPEFVRNVRALAAERPLDHRKILTYCLAQPSPAARIVQAAVKRAGRPLPEIEKAVEDAGTREVRLLRRRGRILSGAAYVAPLLGLLGTVLGMIRCFTEAAAGEAAGRGEALATGLYPSLVPAAAGLAVALPAVILFLMLAARVERLVAELDDLALELVDAIAEPER